ncbi:MAG: hypothetical protein ACKPKO_04605, partial [Candidatus Fonsibacter sp.]
MPMQTKYSEPLDASQYETWQAEVSIWEWNGDVDWDEADAEYQDWDTSYEWQSKTSWLAVSNRKHDSREDISSRVSGIL